MKQGILLLWNPCFHFLSPPSLPSLSFKFPQTRSHILSISASVDSTDTQELTAKERRRLKNEKRETKTTTNWREEVEERLINESKKKKKKPSLAEERNLDNLAKLGPQWWVIRGSSRKGQITAQYLGRSLAKRYPDLDFELYAPTIQVKKRLKNGSYSTKPKPLFSGSIFFRCVLNKELHDFIRNYPGIGGFLGFRIGNTLMRRPKPVSEVEMEAVYRRLKEEQEKADQEFEEEEKKAVLNSEVLKTELEPDSVLKPEADSKPKGKSRKTSATATKKSSTPKLGSTVRVLSGTFAEFTGTLKKFNRKTKIATVAFTLFGKESIIDIEASEIAPVIS